MDAVLRILLSLTFQETLIKRASSQRFTKVLKKRTPQGEEKAQEKEREREKEKERSKQASSSLADKQSAANTSASNATPPSSLTSLLSLSSSAGLREKDKERDLRVSNSASESTAKVDHAPNFVALFSFSFFVCLFVC
jgi:hypothetical protein